MDYTTPPGSGTPPPFQSPPPFITPPASSRPPRRWGWIIISVVLFLLLGLSVLLNLSNLFSGIASMSGGHLRSGGPRLDEVVVEAHRGADKIAIVPIDGVISGHSGDRSGHTMVDIVKAQLQRADDDSDVKAVILRVDSPGGEVLASDEIARHITRFEQRSGKPVIVSMGSLAASGGYYVSAPCSWIVAHELTITGSIGVIMQGYNYRGLMDKVGLRPEVYKSGKFKDMLSGARTAEEVSPEERAMVQKLIDDTYAKFKQVVADGRKHAQDGNKDVRPLVPNWADYADGRVLSGKEALEVGLVDEVGDFEVAVARAQKLAGLTGKSTLIEYQQRLDFADMFSLWGQSEAQVVKLDLGVETPKLEAGRMYFMSPTFNY